MSSTIRNQAKLASVVLAAGLAWSASADVAFAQNGHFLTSGNNAPECTDEGLTVLCTGKVAGLGGTTFEIRISADATALVECTNPGGNVAPGQDTDIQVEGTTGPTPTPRTGQFRFSIETDPPPDPDPTPTCPNEMWDPDIVDVVFDTVTLTLFEDNILSDTVVVIVE
jgi:hypothetical protein